MMRNIRNYPVRQAIWWSIVVRKDTYLSRQTLIFWKSFNRTLLQDDNNDKKYKKWSGQLSNSMIDGRQTLIFRTDTYLIEILSTRPFYRMIIMIRDIRNDLVRRAIRWSMVFKRTLISSKFFQPDSFTHGVNMGRKTRKGDFLERFGLWNVVSWLTSQQSVESWPPV